MQLHSMTLQAVGPFAGRHTVDFAALAASGIFLLEGPTGAGKSTLIDAVVFALYGKVASASASDDRLRSAYADDATDSFVDLTFETGAGVFRVLRTPERLRAKKRGTGTTKQQASVRLWRLPSSAVGPGADLGEPGDVGDLVASRLDEAGLEIQRAVGLDRAQFVQTIVLPQGEFASFLRADPENRRGLLQKVFGTQVYDRAQDELAAMRKAVTQDVVAAQGVLASALDGFVLASGLDDEAATTLRTAGEEHVGKLAAEHVDELTTVARSLARAEELAHAAVTTARAELDVARRTVEGARRRDALRTEQTALDAQAEDVAALAVVLDAARRAALVQPSVAGEQASRAAADAAQEHLVTAVDDARDLVDVSALLVEPQGAGQTAVSASPAVLATLRDGREDDAAQLVHLARLAATEAGLPARRLALARDTDALTSARAELSRAAAALDVRPVERTRRETERDALRARAAELPVRTAEVERAQGVVDGLARLATLESGLADATQARTDAAAVARAASTEESALRLARIAGIAGEIAAGLQDDEPCPVCGSAAHPHPAVLDADHVSQQAVDAAEDARRRAESALAAADLAVAQLTERVRAQQESVGSAGADSASAALAAARTAAQDCTDADRDATVATRDLDAFDAETASLRTAQQERAERVAAAEVRLERDAQSIEDDDATIAAAVTELDLLRTGPDGQPSAEASTVAGAVALLRRRTDLVDALLRAVDTAAAAAAAHAQRRDERDAVLAEHGFASPDEAATAQLDTATVTAHENTVTTHRSSVARVAAGLADPDLADLPASVDVDLDALMAAAAQSEHAARETGRQAALAARQAEDVEGAAARIAAAVARLATVQTAAEPVVRMANLAAGTSSDNTKALTLATFVLVRRFEDVVAAANDRLVTMSDGRYELERSEDREDVRSRRTGLALKVVDHRTETARDPRTLSGGETFYVSLCLALGMADVVTAEAGGIDLGTLFVDEGFGSLDPETLDSVLQVLGGLRAGGRVVGVVSHVEALKQGIADGISVRRLPDGSSTLTVRAG